MGQHERERRIGNYSSLSIGDLSLFRGEVSQSEAKKALPTISSFGSAYLRRGSEFGGTCVLGIRINAMILSSRITEYQTGILVALKPTEEDLRQVRNTLKKIIPFREERERLSGITPARKTSLSREKPESPFLFRKEKCPF
jgi:hypothetical protein